MYDKQQTKTEIIEVLDQLILPELLIVLSAIEGLLDNHAHNSNVKMGVK